MLLLLLIYVVLRALWKIDVYLISTLVNKSIYYSLFIIIIPFDALIVLNVKSFCYLYTIMMRVI